MAMIMRGWVNIDQDGEHQLKYNHQRRDLFHLWSAKEFGHAFGLREYNKFISFKEYVDMPIDIIQDLLEGCARGMEDLAKVRKQAADRAASEVNNGKLNKSELAAIAAAQRGD